MKNIDVSSRGVTTPQQKSQYRDKRNPHVTSPDDVMRAGSRRKIIPKMYRRMCRRYRVALATPIGCTDPREEYHMFRLLLVDIRDPPYHRLHHLDGVSAEEPALVVDQLAPEAVVRVHDRPASLAVPIGLLQSHALILHQVGDAQAGRPADAGNAVHQSLASCPAHLQGHRGTPGIIIIIKIDMTRCNTKSGKQAAAAVVE